MEYRKLPKGIEKFSAIGIGLGGIQNNSDEEIQRVCEAAIENGINYFDLCAGGPNVFAPFGKAIAGRRDKVYIQMHFGAVYSNGKYGWSRDLDTIKKTFEWELKTIGTDYIDMGYFHCADDYDDYDEIMSSGIFDYVRGLKESGVIRHLGFSSHSPYIAREFLDTGLMDMFMFSINPAYDFDAKDGKATLIEDRAALYRECEQAGIGISVMKTFHGGKLLDKETSPFKTALSKYQCMQYALDRPAVLTVLPGVRNMNDMQEIIGFLNASKEEKDYSVIGTFTSADAEGNCVYCNHCQPCPKGMDIGLINKYYDLVKAGDEMAKGHYEKLNLKAGDCISCGHCEERCPFHVKQINRMKEIQEFFGC